LNLLCANFLRWETRNAADCDGRAVFIGLYFQLFGRSPRNRRSTISWIDEEVPTAKGFQSTGCRRNALESIPSNDSHVFDPIKVCPPCSKTKTDFADHVFSSDGMPLLKPKTSSGDEFSVDLLPRNLIQKSKCCEQNGCTSRRQHLLRQLAFL
jgi:hypothetical protein